ncbi:MAG: sulfotransferase [Anaerolineae bacterium]|nr:sulfotransferase [Anaerolineae bacterium]
MTDDASPIFIGGPDRCGKTTLRACLVSHPRISIPAVGSNMWSYFYGQYGDLGREENLERCLAALLRYKHVRCLDPDPVRIRREFAGGPRTYGRLFSLIHRHHAEREGKPRWGDQTGLIERYADVIFAEFPGARMVHLLRDPRDRYHASLELWPDGKGRAGGATARWLYSARLARRNLRRYPGQYFVIRFEDLVRRPEETLRAVCVFLDETYTPAMPAMTGAPEYREKRSHGRALQPDESPLSDEFIGLYRRTIPPPELAFMQRLAGREMVLFGYAPDELHLSTGDRMRLAIDYPVNLARMAAWRSVEGLQQTFPSIFGRSPGGNMILPVGDVARPAVVEASR